MTPELGAWGPVVAACTRLDPAQRCTLPALAAYLADNAAALGAEVGGHPAASPAPAGGAPGADPGAGCVLAAGELGASVKDASAMGLAPACGPSAQQAHAAQMLWGGAWGGMAGLPAQTAGHSANGTCAHSVPCAGAGAVLGAAPLPIPSSAAVATRSGSGASLSAPDSPMVPVGCSAMGCVGISACGAWAQPAAHPCSAGWSPGAVVLAQPQEPEGGSYPSSARWSPWRGVPAQPQASSAELGGCSYPSIAGWSPWGGVPAHNSTELVGGGYPCIAGWSPWGGVPAQPQASGAPQELHCGAFPCSGALPQPQLDAASQAQVATACTAIEAFVAAQGGFLASDAHADAAALEERAAGARGRMRDAANAAGRPARAWKRVPSGGWSGRGSRAGSLNPGERDPDPGACAPCARVPQQPCARGASGPRRACGAWRRAPMGYGGPGRRRAHAPGTLPAAPPGGALRAAAPRRRAADLAHTAWRAGVGSRGAGGPLRMGPLCHGGEPGRWLPLRRCAGATLRMGDGARC